MIDIQRNHCPLPWWHFRLSLIYYLYREGGREGANFSDLIGSINLCVERKNVLVMKR